MSNKQHFPHQLKTEIKDIVISRLLTTITTLSTDLLHHQQENTFLKKALTFVLKKFILFHPTSDNHAHHTHTSSLTFKPFCFSPSKPTNSFQYIPTDFPKANTVTSRCSSNNNRYYNKTEVKLHEYVNSMYQHNNNIMNTRKTYFINNDCNFLYKDLINSERKNSSYLTLNTESMLNKHHSQKQINMHKLRKKPSLNRITYRNFSMRNITNSSKMLDDDNNDNNNENGNKRFTTPKIKVCSKKNKSKLINLMNTIDCNSNNNNYLTTTTSLHKKNKVVVNINSNSNNNNQSAKKHSSNVYSHIYSHKGKLNTSRSPFLRNKI